MTLNFHADCHFFEHVIFSPRTGTYAFAYNFDSDQHLRSRNCISDGLEFRMHQLDLSDISWNLRSIKREDKKSIIVLH